MTLNLTNIKDLDYIAELAQHYMALPQARTVVMPGEGVWVERIARYRQLFAVEIQKAEPIHWSANPAHHMDSRQ